MGSNNPVRGVTSENFVRLGKAFIAANGDKGFIIALRPYPGWPAGEKFIPTPRQWGAWMVYWVRLEYKTKAMQERGYATTPSEWPHEFDAHATIQGDHLCADAFEREWRNEREARAFQAAGVVKATSKALEKWRYERSSKPVPASHLAPPAEPAIDISDFPDIHATPAQLRDWEDRQKERAA
jgi:hypothetical protein